jgi:hypothetical protein
MHELFDFGVRCALRDELFSTPVELLDRVAATHLRPPSPEPDCPAPANSPR